MARLTETVHVDADVEHCFALLTAPPALPRSTVLGLGGQRVEYRDTTVEVTTADPVRKRVVLSAGDGSGRLRARIAATLHPGPTGTRIDLVTDLDVTGSGADVARALLPSLARRALTDLAAAPPAAVPRAAVPRAEPPAPVPPRRRTALLVATAALAAAVAGAAVVRRVS